MSSTTPLPGTTRQQPTYRATAHVVRGERYLPLGDSGPAAQFHGPENVTVRIEPSETDGLRVEAGMRLEDGRYRIGWLSFDTAEGWIDFEQVRRLRLREYIAQALARRVETAAETTDGTTRFEDPMTHPDPSWRVAATYLVARATGANPTLAVAEDFGISRGAAAARVGYARKKGYLAPATQGER